MIQNGFELFASLSVPADAKVVSPEEAAALARRLFAHEKAENLAAGIDYNPDSQQDRDHQVFLVRKHFTLPHGFALGILKECRDGVKVNHFMKAEDWEAALNVIESEAHRGALR